MANHPIDWPTWSALDATGLTTLIREQNIPLAEITHQLAAAVDALNPKINSVIELFDDAISDPGNSGANPEGRFFGVPILIKDMGSQVANQVQQIGLGFKKPAPATSDDPLIENLRQAGFIVAGRTTVPESGMTLITHSIPQGDTRNPFNLQRTPGGSSGGSAASVASGIVPICSASDGAGSIRFPAAWTGLIGLKCTRGVNPLPRGLNESLLAGAVEGVLVKTVRDCAAVYEELAIHRYLGRSFMPPPILPHLSLQADQADRKLTIGVSLEPWGSTATVDPIIRTQTQAFVDRLKQLGHTIIYLDPDSICDFHRLRESFTIAEWLVPISKELQYEVALSAEELTDDNASVQLRNHLSLCDRYDLDDFLAAKVDTEALMRQWGLFWQQGQCDVIVSPVTPVTCPSLATDYRMDSPLDFDDWFSALMDAACFTIPANHMGLPAMSLPIGLDNNQCPIGAQLMAPWLHEHQLIHLASQVEKAFPDAFNMAPPLSTRHL